MNLGRRELLVSALGAASFSGRALADTPEPTPALGVLSRNIDRMARAAVEERLTPAVALSVLRHGKPVYARAFGWANLELRSPVSTESVFRIGSVTKQFTAAAIVQLAERGGLSLDEPVMRHLPELPRADRVTIRQLLTHTSGVHDFTRAKLFDERETRFSHTTDEMVEFIARQDPNYDFDPGTRWSYSNSGYYLLGAIIERVSKATLRDYMRANIFDPLDMKQSDIDVETMVVRGRVAGYDRDSKAASGFSNTSFVSMSVPGGAGAMISTLGDLTRWSQGLASGRVVSHAGLAQMTAAGRLADGRNATDVPFRATQHPRDGLRGYGFGLRLGEDAGRRWVGHPGAINGFMVWLKRYVDSDVTLIVLTNTDGAVEPITEALAAIVLDGKPARAARGQ